jgi:hypothetical protein
MPTERHPGPAVGHNSGIIKKFTECSRYVISAVSQSGICLGSSVVVLKIFVIKLWVAGDAFSQQCGAFSFAGDFQV